MSSRRRTILGLGGLIAGAGALISTGAFDTVQAERSVGLETAGDANAFLSMESLDEEFVDPDAELIEFEIPGRASVTYNELVRVTNRGTQTVTSLRFEFVVEGADQPDADVEDAMRIVSADAEIDAVDDANLIASSDAGDAGNDQLDPGDSIPFGIKIDLTAADIDEISGDPDITLRIIAESGEVDDGNGGPPPGAAMFEYAADPSREPQNNTINFGIENVGDSGATLDGFRIEFPDGGPGGSEPPEDFEDSEISPPTGEVIDAGSGKVTEDISHTQYDIFPDDTAEYTIEELDRNPSESGVNLDVTVISTDGEEFGLPRTEI